MNGRVEIGEQCDDGNMRDNDGCSNCIIDPITLLFNDSAPSTEPYEREFFDVDQVTFFVENGDSLSVEFIPPDLVRELCLCFSAHVLCVHILCVLDCVRPWLCFHASKNENSNLSSTLL